MRRIFFVLLVMLMATFACVRANTPVDKTSSSLIQSLNLPTTARVAAESYNLIVFANVDSTYNEMDVVTLWTYKPKDKTLLKLLTTNPRSDYECLGYEDKAQRVSFTSILTINNVYINAEEDKILVEGNDDRNCYSYIITLTDGLPTIQCHAMQESLGCLQKKNCQLLSHTLITRAEEDTTSYQSLTGMENV